jgi:hypothetical protein
MSQDEIAARVDGQMWWPEYLRYRPAGLTARM